MEPKIIFCMLTVLLRAATAEAADSTVTTNDTASGGITSSSTENAPEEKRPIRYQGAVSYITSRTATHDYRSFKTVATDDTGQMNTGSSMPNLNYMSARLGVSPFEGQSFTFSTLQSLDSPATRTIPTNSGDSRTLPGSIYSARYGYRIDPKWSVSAGENYVPELQGWSDPQLNATYRPKEFWEQGWAPRLGFGVSVPTTLRSHNDQLITQATARTGLSYVSGRWTTSGSVSYSRAIYEHPSQMSAMNWGATPGQNPTTPVNPNTPRPCKPGRPCNHISDPNAPVDPNIGPESFNFISQERTLDRATTSLGLLFAPSDNWKLSTGTGLTYIETWRQHAIWLTSAKVLGAAYDFWKMEAGSDLSLFSDVNRFKHPALPSLMAVGFHLTYFMGADHNMPLN